MKSRIETRFNKIYYQDEYDVIKELDIFQHKKIKILEAEDILIEREIKFNNVFKVLLETVVLEIPDEEIKNYIKKGDR